MKTFSIRCIQLKPGDMQTYGTKLKLVLDILKIDNDPFFLRVVSLLPDGLVEHSTAGSNWSTQVLRVK